MLFCFYIIMRLTDLQFFFLILQADEEANWNPYFEGRQLEVAAKKSPWVVKPAQWVVGFFLGGNLASTTVILSSPPPPPPPRPFFWLKEAGG